MEGCSLLALLACPHGLLSLRFVLFCFVVLLCFFNMVIGEPLGEVSLSPFPGLLGPLPFTLLEVSQSQSSNKKKQVLNLFSLWNHKSK